MRSDIWNISYIELRIFLIQVEQALLNEKAEQYNTIETAKKQDLLNKKAKQFRDCYGNQRLNRQSFT